MMHFVNLRFSLGCNSSERDEKGPMSRCRFPFSYDVIIHIEASGELVESAKTTFRHSHPSASPLGCVYCISHPLTCPPLRLSLSRPPKSSNLIHPISKTSTMISCCQDVSGITCQAFLHDSLRRNLGFQLSFGRDGRPDLLTVPEDSLSQLLQVGGTIAIEREAG
jgi:hypothetical protein